MMAAQSQLQQPAFTLNLKSSTKGNISFGYVDKKQYKGDLMTAPVDNETYPAWVVREVTLTSGKAKVTQPMLFGNHSPYPCSATTPLDFVLTKTKSVVRHESYHL